MNFYPGPSKLFPSVEKHLQEAYQSGILSRNHRSPIFSALLKSTVDLLKEKLKIPFDYTIVFTSSATECWEIIAQSFTQNGSYHIYNGAFGEKWKSYTDKITNKATSYEFDVEESLIMNDLKLNHHDLICITQNETSNGTQVSNTCLKTLRESYSSLIAVDATSSLGGVYLDISQADIWFASVQKCFGLPSGLAILVLSPQAIQQGKLINDDQHYNSFIKLYTNANKYQTSYTPNILNLFLLNRRLNEMPIIHVYDQQTSKRISQWYEFLETTKLTPLINNKEVRSKTVLPIKGNNIEDILNLADQKNIILGKGYGKWKDSTFRISNFPALTIKEINQLQTFLQQV